jgi:hypothetical protein
MTDHGPLKEIQDGVIWYYEQGAEDPTKHQGYVEIYPNWVRIVGGPTLGVWIPRERVDQIHQS